MSMVEMMEQNAAAKSNAEMNKLLGKYIAAKMKSEGFDVVHMDDIDKSFRARLRRTWNDIRNFVYKVWLYELHLIRKIAMFYKSKFKR